MHFHFDFSATQILWTLSFAAELVLLIVLMGRDRVKRFPLFTTFIVVMALMLLVTRLLFGRMPAVTTSIIFLVMSNIAAIVNLLVVIEIAHRAFAGVRRAWWRIATFLSLVIAAVVLLLWGPWPAASTFTGNSVMLLLRFMQLFADKGANLGALLGIELGILVAIFGRRFHGGWRSHPQQIAIGLSMAGLSQLVTRAIWQHIANTRIIHSQAEYAQALKLRDNIYNANNIVFVLVVIWWIAWLWLDEPGTARTTAEQLPETPTEELP
jgi:hypothetical protein